MNISAAQLLVRNVSFVLAAILCASLFAGLVSLSDTAEAQSNDPVFVGAGDIADCSSNRDEATAKLLDGIAGTVFTLGDNVYPNGKQAEFRDCYGSTWGQHKDRTRPSPGNHDYNTTGAAGYYTYFVPAATPLEPNCTSGCKGYYSYNLGAWHIIALNSEVSMSAGSAQEKWLRADLAANPSACTLAYWHKPRFSSGQHGNYSGTQPLWQALYDYGADVVLSGHDHTYERFAPQSPSGNADSARGIREFVVGTGGAGLYSFSTIKANSEVRNNSTWGILKLTLHATSYDWEFIPIAGQNFTDSGSANCVGGTVPPPPPPSSGPIFSDVVIYYWAWQYIERLYRAGITGGCSTSPLMYCPENQVTRAQMSVFLEKGIHYPTPFNPANVAPTFGDTAGHWAEDWIEALKGDGITSGCGVGKYCPEDPVTRAQMAIFLLKSRHGSGYTPPAVGSSTGFNDVATTHWAAAWIKQLAAESITGGCGGGNYCPDAPVTRAQMAVFLVRTFNLP